MKLTAQVASESQRLWPLQELDPCEVATWPPELRRRFYQAIRDRRGMEIFAKFVADVTAELWAKHVSETA